MVHNEFSKLLGLLFLYLIHLINILRSHTDRTSLFNFILLSATHDCLVGFGRIPAASNAHVDEAGIVVRALQTERARLLIHLNGLPRRYRREVVRWCHCDPVVRVYYHHLSWFTPCGGRQVLEVRRVLLVLLLLAVNGPVDYVIPFELILISFSSPSVWLHGAVTVPAQIIYVLSLSLPIRVGRSGPTCRPDSSYIFRVKWPLLNFPWIHPPNSRLNLGTIADREFAALLFRTYVFTYISLKSCLCVLNRLIYLRLDCANIIFMMMHGTNTPIVLVRIKLYRSECLGLT